MGKKWQKPKAKHQKKKDRRKKQNTGSTSGSSGAAGTMGGMRGAFKKVVRGKGDGQKSTASKVFDAALWIAVIVAAYVFYQRQCAG